MHRCRSCGGRATRDGARCLVCHRARPRQTRAEKLAFLRQWQARVKDEVFTAYGGYRCACCGVSEPVFLVIDHIADDGHDERKRLGTKGGMGQYWYLRKRGFPAGYQVLCQNCNWAKAHGGCPHATGSEREAAQADGSGFS